jgi:PLP dependent protein
MTAVSTEQEASIGDRYARLGERIAQAAQRAGREAAGIRLIAVSKTQPPEAIAAAWRAGLRFFGENHPEEAAPKFLEVQRLLGLPEPMQWQMIGHLQSRKARIVAEGASLLHSLDDVRTAVKLDALMAGRGRALDVLLEINISGEAGKSGANPAAAGELLGSIAQCGHLRVCGLMTVAPMSANPEDLRRVFSGLRDLRDGLQRAFPNQILTELSMGMSDDFEVAIEEGATLIRIGRALFGPRQVVK